MKYVTGLGGFFFRAKDPSALGEWYEQALGVPGYEKGWTQASGPTVFAPFPAGTDYFSRPEQQWMLNFRVRDLDGLMAHLRGLGIEIITNPDWDSEVGRFARIHDPEGNPVELWEPAGEGA